MSEMTLEQRVTALERKLKELEIALENRLLKRDWRRTIGMFTGDEVMKQIDQAALDYREADREKARRRYAKRPKAKR